LTRLALSLLPDGRSAPMPPDTGRPVDWYRETLAVLLDHLAAGKIDPVLAGRFPLLDAAAAHRFLEQQPHAGRAALVTT
jgi:NADPH:quinone reductase-like Zn-dependent oxidoreductase